MKPNPAKTNGPAGGNLTEPVQTSSTGRKTELNTDGDNTPLAGLPDAVEAARRGIEKAAMWLADEPEPPKVPVPTLREKFSLSALQACEAIALARKFQINRRAFG